MRIRHVVTLFGTALALSAFGLSAEAQKPGMPTTSGSHGFHFPGTHRLPSIGSGQIVGNKNTHVYHLPGDKGAMPAEKNRVYFHSEREAMSAGYHAAGSKRMTSSHGSQMNSHRLHSVNHDKMGQNGHSSGTRMTPNGAPGAPLTR